MEEIIKDHLWPIIDGHVQWIKESTHPELVARTKTLSESFPHLMEYHGKWTEEVAKDHNLKYVGIVAMIIAAVVFILGVVGLITNLS